MPVFRIPVNATFEAVVTVEAADREEALEYIKSDEWSAIAINDVNAPLILEPYEEAEEDEEPVLDELDEDEVYELDEEDEVDEDEDD